MKKLLILLFSLSFVLVTNNVFALSYNHNEANRYFKEGNFKDAAKYYKKCSEKKSYSIKNKEECKSKMDIALRLLEDEVLDALITKLKEKKSCLSCNLERVNLEGLKLRGVNLRAAKLNMSNLRDTNLQGADLSLSDLSEADLTNTNFNGANLTGANLTGANLTGANLTGTNFNGANLTGAKILTDKVMRIQFSGTNLSNATLSKKLKQVLISTAEREGFASWEEMELAQNLKKTSEADAKIKSNIKRAQARRVDDEKKEKDRIKAILVKRKEDDKEKERLKNFKTLNMSCMYSINGRYLTYSWAYDGKKLYWEGIPINFGKSNIEQGMTTSLRKLPGKDRFNIKITGIGAMEFNNDFDSKNSEMDYVGMKAFGSCY